jgi:hypothetical protein
MPIQKTNVCLWYWRDAYSENQSVPVPGSGGTFMLQKRVKEF